ncbi:hypothetical protein ES707_19110 [subsurface metagenome]
MTETSEKILDAITNHYLQSGDFNGISIEELQTIVGLTQKDLEVILIQLVHEEKISINFGDRHPNPYIKAFDPESKSEQIEKLKKYKLQYACVYPEKKHLQTVVNTNQYSGRPFTLKLALGEAQLSYLSFDLSVLEVYRNDPRYHYSTDDIQGWISISDRYYESEEVPESDQVLLESFSFSYDREFKRTVAVFLIYLSRLSPEHQQIWNARLIEGTFTLHPEYALSVCGRFPENESVFTAFITELQVINEMCAAMGKPPLFHNDFKDKGKPREFSFLIRPTAKEFQDFVLILDKMLSDNINRDFFKGDVDLEDEITRSDGKIQVIQKGTIRLLEEWIKQKFPVEDSQPITDMIECFKEVRKIRQRPAHALDDNEFNQEFFKKQRDLIFKTYASLRALRLLLANHPKCKQIVILDWLYEGKISPF